MAAIVLHVKIPDATIKQQRFVKLHFLNSNYSLLIRDTSKTHTIRKLKEKQPPQILTKGKNIEFIIVRYYGFLGLKDY